MKSLKKLRDMAWQKHGSKATTSSSALHSKEEPEEISKGMQDVEAMRSQYEDILTAAQTISSSAYDFSTALQDMASFMVKYFVNIADGEIGNIFSILSKLQFEIAKFLDLYAAHVSETLTYPLESLLSELQHVENMKEQYDERRQLYNSVVLQKHKGKSKDAKGDATDKQLLAEKYDLEVASVALSVRLQSLKKGKTLSLITQAVRYYTAQRSLFSKCVASLDAVEPVAKKLAEEHNIDRKLSEGHVGIYSHGDSADMNADILENDEDSDTAVSSPMSVKEIETHDNTNDSLLSTQGFTKFRSVSKSSPISATSYNQTDANLETREVSSDLGARKYALPSPSGATARWNQSPLPHSLLVFPKNQYSPLSETLAKNNLHVKQDSSMRNDSSLQFIETSHVNPPKHIQQNNMPVHTAEEKLQKEKAFHRYIGEVSQQAERKYSHSGPLVANKNMMGSKQAAVKDDLLLREQIDQYSKSGPIRKSLMSGAFHSPRISATVAPQPDAPRISELYKLPPPPSSKPLIAHSAPLQRQYQDPSSNSSLPLRAPVSTQGIDLSADHVGSMHAFSFKHPRVPLPIGVPPSPTLRPIVLPSSSSSEASEFFSL